MRKITHLLVDLDGTLVNGDRPKMRLDFMTKVMAKWHDHGGLMKTVMAFHYMRKAAESLPNGETNDVRIVRAFAQAFRLDEKRAKIVLEESVREVFPLLSRYFSPVPGAADFISWGKANYTLILATNPIWMPEAVELRVKWAGIDMKSFRSFTHAGRMRSCKPRLEYYQELLKQEALDPKDCMLIGNDPKKDLPASKVGIPVFLVARDSGRSSSFYRPLIVDEGAAPAWFGTYAGLKSLLESLC